MAVREGPFDTPRPLLKKSFMRKRRGLILPYLDDFIPHATGSPREAYMFHFATLATSARRPQQPLRPACKSGLLRRNLKRRRRSPPSLANFVAGLPGGAKRFSYTRTVLEYQGRGWMKKADSGLRVCALFPVSTQRLGPKAGHTYLKGAAPEDGGLGLLRREGQRRCAR